MPKTNPNKHNNVYAADFIKQLAPTLSAKRARMITKHLAKGADFSFFFALPKLASQYIDENTTSVHIVLDQIADNDLIDHGRWFALIPFILNRRDLDVKVTILKNEAIESQQSNYATFIEYLIENELTGQFTSEVFEGAICDMPASDLATVDVYVTPSPSKRYLSNKAVQSSIRTLVQQPQTRVVLTDIDRTALLFSLSAYNRFSVGTLSEIKKNPAGLNIQAHMSKNLKHAGVSLELDTVSNEVALVNDFFINDEEIYQCSLHMTRLVHFGDSLRKLPNFPIDTPSHFFDNIVADVTSGKVQYLVDGNHYQMHLDDLPTFTFDHYCDNNLNHVAQLYLYALHINVTIHRAFLEHTALQQAS